MKEMFVSVAEAGKREGLVMNMLETIGVNTFDGHRLIHFATKYGKQDEAIEAMFKAYFTDNKDVSSKEVLQAAVEALGLDGAEFTSALAGSELADAVRDDLRQAASLGIQGVPFFVIDTTFGISGARGTEAFLSALNKAWADSHPLHILDDGEANVCTDTSCV